ncbi:MAG: SGNH/GDSL hydrolase family protein [Calditrichaeota bacterium]|nr:SGNH/GDSL hydrolase family protein [Calditrichota bacterium]
MAKNILAFVISVVLILLLSELAFRLYTNNVVIYDIEMLRYAKQLKRESSEPGLTHEHIPNSSAFLENVHIDLNSMGFRDEEIELKKEENDYRILIAGSSVTMGWGVPYDSVFTTYVENELNAAQDSLNYQLVNTGIGNYNSILEGILLAKNYSLLNPDMVILHYFINDAEYISSKKNSFIVRNSHLAAFLYVKIMQAVVIRESNYESIGEYYRDLYKKTSPGWMKTQEAIISIKELCAHGSTKFLVILQPDLHDLNPNSLQSDCHKVIRAFLSENEIDYLDIMPAYMEHFGENPSLIWVHWDDPHPNHQGHKVLGDELIKYLLFAF